ncbi:unnamed protein product [Prunus armeniaca]
MASKASFSISPRVKRKEEKEEKEERRKRSFLKNGSMLLEDLIASCDGKSHPIRCYSAAEIIRAANNFDPSCVIDDGYHRDMYRGILDDRTVIIMWHYRIDEAIRDIIISMQMSTHKNSLKLLGCCLEFERPPLVFENAGKGGLNFDGSLVADNELLPWKTRLRIAKQLASALTYLHTAFPRPIVHRNLRSTCILLDDDYVPKLFDFSSSITIPPEQLYVEVDTVTGTYGYVDSNYMATGYVSTKTDVYSFGALLFVFLMRKIPGGEIVREYLTRDPKLNVSDGQIQIETIADPKILEEVGGDEQAQQQLQDFLALALLCIQEKTEARPDMIDVAKELVRIDKSILPR